MDFTPFFDHYIEQSLLLLIKKQPLRDILQNSCSKLELNQLKYARERVLFLQRLRPGYRGLSLNQNQTSSLVFFKDFNHTICLIHYYSFKQLF